MSATFSMVAPVKPASTLHRERVARPLDRPCFHIAPRKGWLNDPNGPLYFKGTYHMFYQHALEGCEWQFGLVWGHAVSEDLVSWKHLPPAIRPTEGWYDSEGCWSGSATVDHDGRPTILYTGVRVQGRPTDIQSNPPECDLGREIVESQLIAVAEDLDDAELTHWRKLEVPMAALPPAHLPLTAWRDPFVIEKPQFPGEDWVVMLAGGLAGRGGGAVTYASKDLKSGWQYTGELCGGGTELGTCWECPVIAPLLRPRADGLPASHVHMLCACPDDCRRPPVYWLGHYCNSRFDLAQADGPYVLDLGDVFYAPQLLQSDAKGRTLMWGWQQERREKLPEGSAPYDYAGCLSSARVLQLNARGQLMQQPMPELKALRQSGYVASASKLLQPGSVMPFKGVTGPFLDLEIDVQSAGASHMAVLFAHFDDDSKQLPVYSALVFDFDQNSLHVLEGVHMDQLVAGGQLPAARCGGVLSNAEGTSRSVSLRVLLDFSLLEVYVGTGEVLSSRLYRGALPADLDGAGLALVAMGGALMLQHHAAFEMRSIWDEAAPLQLEPVPEVAPVPMALPLGLQPGRLPVGQCDADASIYVSAMRAGHGAKEGMEQELMPEEAAPEVSMLA